MTEQEGSVDLGNYRLLNRTDSHLSDKRIFASAGTTITLDVIGHCLHWQSAPSCHFPAISRVRTLIAAAWGLRPEPEWRGGELEKCPGNI